MYLEAAARSRKRASPRYVLIFATMAQDHVSDDVDWVTAQSKCNAASIFARLQTGVMQDVDRRNSLRRPDDDLIFEFHDEDDAFEVTRGNGRDKVDAAVKFERAGRRIHVLGEDIDVDFTAVVTLDVTGACRLVVGEAMYSEWEIRRMALEQLFFEDDAAD
jgi:hypothetical protein